MNDKLRKLRKMLEDSLPYLEEMRNEHMIDNDRPEKIALTKLIKEIYLELDKTE